MDVALIFMLLILLQVFMVEAVTMFLRRDMISLTTGFAAVTVYLIFLNEFWWGIAEKVAGAA